MPTVVIDASAIAAILFDEPFASRILLQTDGCNLTAPTVIQYELTSVARKKYAAYPELRDVWRRNLREYPALRVQERPIVPAAVFALAVDTGLTTYDASYLWLARHLGVPLITLDGDLAAAALV